MQLVTLGGGESQSRVKCSRCLKALSRLVFTMTDTNNGEQEKTTFTKLTDFKKKISLLEGKRKALYTKFEKEKKRNKERESELGGEIVNAHKDYIKSLTTDETILTKVENFPHLNTKVLERLSPNSAVLSLDYKVANLQVSEPEIFLYKN